MNLRLFLSLLYALRNPRSRALLDFHESQIRFLMAHFPKRPVPSPAEKACMAQAASKVGRKTLEEVFTLFTPETLLRWHRDSVRRKWDHSDRRGPGRPPTLPEIEKLILEWAEQNPTWGYKHLRDALRNVGHIVSRSTIQNILRKHGIQPAPQRRRGMSWSEFLRVHQEALVGMDFFTWEVLTPFGLVPQYVLFLIRHATREVHVAGITTNPGTEFMKQVARNLTMPDWGWLKRGRIALHDRAGQFSPAFRHILRSEGIRTIQLPFQSPNLNAYAERWVRSVKEECLSRMIITGEPMLRNALNEYVRHFHGERNHQGLGGAIPFPGPELSPGRTRAGPIHRRQRLGGLLNYYYRECA
jgi:putative transposase